MSEQRDKTVVLTSTERAHLYALFISLADEMECEVQNIVPADLHSTVEFIIASRVKAAMSEALRDAAQDLGSYPQMRVLVERESCDWWSERPVNVWLCARADRIEVES